VDARLSQYDDSLSSHAARSYSSRGVEDDDHDVFDNRFIHSTRRFASCLIIVFDDYLDASPTVNFISWDLSNQ
jgi:hypothetical protein